MINKTYKTLDGAYARADKLGAKCFGVEFYGYSHRVNDAISTVFNTQVGARFARHNLVKLDSKLYALECTNDDVYKWLIVGSFDHEGIFYPAVVQKKLEPTKVIEDKPRKRTRKLKGEAKSAKATWQTELDAYAGKGRQANKEVALILRKHKMEAKIGSEGWTYWESIR